MFNSKRIKELEERIQALEFDFASFLVIGRPVKKPAKKGRLFECYCGKKFKNERGKKIHAGRMHK
jgi:hypothetical protein